MKRISIVLSRPERRRLLRTARKAPDAALRETLEETGIQANHPAGGPVHFCGRPAWR